MPSVTSKISRIFIASYKGDVRLTRICVASIRHWYPEIPITLIKDYSWGRFPTGDICRRWKVDVLDIRSCFRKSSARAFLSATTVGSVREMFRGSQAATLVPPRDEKALAVTTLAILEKRPSSYRERRASAYEVFRRTSSKAAVEASLRRVLEKLKQC